MRFRYLAFIAMVLVPATAHADFFIFKATTDPMTLSYLPVGSGHYNHPGASEGVSGSSDASTSQFFGTTNVEFGAVQFAQGYVPQDLNSPFPCFSLDPGYCFNQPWFFSAQDGTALGRYTAGLGVYDSAGNPLALFSLVCTGDVICDMSFWAGAGGNPIDLSVQPAWFQNDFANDPKIVAGAGTQDAIDARFYDGLVDSFEFILQPVPEPTSIIFLGTVVIVVGFGIKRKFSGTVLGNLALGKQR
jgi:hypothetical protein